MIFETLRELIAELFSVEADDIGEDTLLEDDLGADPLDLEELAMILEEEFDLPEIDPSVLSGSKSVGDVVNLIRGYK